MELVRGVRAVREEKAVKVVKAVKGQEIGIPGASPVPAPPPAVYPAFSPAAMVQPSAPAVAASAAHLNDVEKVCVHLSTGRPPTGRPPTVRPPTVRPLTDRLPLVFPAIALAQTASPTSGDPEVALKVVPRAAVLNQGAPSPAAQMADALKGAVAPMADALIKEAALRLADLLPSR